MNKQKKLVPFAVILIGLGIGGFLTLQVSDNTVYYYTVSEALASEANRSIRISGHAQTGSIQRDAEQMKLQFVVYDRETSAAIPVQYEGPIPDIFKDEVEVVVEGAIENGTFMATNLLAKCPSKYEKKGEASDFKDVEIPHEFRSDGGAQAPVFDPDTH